MKDRIASLKGNIYFLIGALVALVSIFAVLIVVIWGRWTSTPFDPAGKDRLVANQVCTQLGNALLPAEMGVPRDQSPAVVGVSQSGNVLTSCIFPSAKGNYVSITLPKDQWVALNADGARELQTLAMTAPEIANSSVTEPLTGTPTSLSAMRIVGLVFLTFVSLLLLGGIGFAFHYLDKKETATPSTSAIGPTTSEVTPAADPIVPAAAAEPEPVSPLS